MTYCSVPSGVKGSASKANTKSLIGATSMNWLKHLLLSTLTVFISAIIGIIIVELIGSHLLKSDTLTYGPKERFIFYSDSIDGNIFKNIGRFFLYEPRARIRNVTYYLVNGVWIKEYDYYFGTNNLGLVQTSDIDLNKKSILLLGNLFTQGIGSPPWTDELSKEITNDKYQIVNGGILGGGVLLRIATTMEGDKDRTATPLRVDGCAPYGS